MKGFLLFGGDLDKNGNHDHHQYLWCVLVSEIVHLDHLLHLSN